MRVLPITAASVLLLAAGRVAAAQERVSRTAAVASAISHAPRVAMARADSAGARAELLRARQYENPILALAYSKDPPEHHVGFEFPLDLPWFRTPRVGFAQASLDAAALRFAFDREAVAFDADTSYTQALAAAARARLSRGTARDADSLVVLARVRRDAGDGSELDVQLAMVSAGQLANTAATDSIDALGALLALQAVMGLDAVAPTVVLADTLELHGGAARSSGTPLLIAAAEQNARAADLGVERERRLRFAMPALTLGFDTHDPGGQGNAILPAIGIAMPLPLFNQNAGGVQAAQAQRDRAQAELAQTRIDVNAALAQARRTLAVATARATRSRALVDGANRVAALSLVAYREGAAPLSSVLEAQRTARETLAQYVNDVAAAYNAASLAELLARTATTVTAATGTNR